MTIEEYFFINPIYEGTVPAKERGRSTLKCRNTPLIEA